MTAMRTSRGFSLFELMVVIVIVGLMFSFTTLNLRPDTPEELIRDEARRFNQLLGLLLDEAVLRGEDFGIEFKPRSYQFARLDNENRWVAVDNDRILRPRELPDEMEIDLTVEQTEIVLQQATSTEITETEIEVLEPQVFALSSGEFTPEFSAAFFYPTLAERYLVTGRFDGQHNAKAED